LQSQRITLIGSSTVNDLTAHIDTVRRLPSDGEAEYSQKLGYFIEVPHGTSVTVNGITYTNTNGHAMSTPCCIGPLERYTIIELLSQQVFSVRSQGNLNYSATTRIAGAEEVTRRDRNGDAEIGNTTVRWTPIIPTSPGPGIVASLPIDDVKFSDAGTDEGTAIEDPYDYLRRRLVTYRGGRIRALIPRVLASVNLRQEEGSGFSFLSEERILRPGRTLIAPVEHGGHHALATTQAQPGERVTIRTSIP
jgi:hypothetical protein